jgi:hypothetical protein
MEGIYYGVPMVGMPIFIDQGDVLIKMKEKGIALGFNKDNTTAEEIYQTLREVLTNPRYKENIMKLSYLMRDVNETPLERVIQFLEFLIRHKGAEHLKLSSRNLNFIQYFSIDTLSFLALATFILLYLQYKVLHLLFRKTRLLQMFTTTTTTFKFLSLDLTAGQERRSVPESSDPFPLYKEPRQIERSISSGISELALYRDDSTTLKYEEKKRI